MQELVSALMHSEKNIKFCEIVERILINYYNMKNEKDLIYFTKILLQNGFCVNENKLKYYDLTFNEMLYKSKDYIIVKEDDKDVRMLTPSAFFSCLVTSQRQDLIISYIYIQEILNCYNLHMNTMNEQRFAEQCFIICKLYDTINKEPVESLIKEQKRK